MRYPIILLFFVVISSTCFGQQVIPDSLNLDSGEYKFYFVEGLDMEDEVEPLSMAGQFNPELPFEFELDTTGSFLIEDKQQLLDLKSSWLGVATDEVLLCSYDYLVYIVKDNQILHELRVNTRCGQVITDSGVFNFEGNPLEQLKKRIPIWVMSSKHKTLQAGRAFIQSLNQNIMLTEKKHWFDFDGHFSVEGDFRESSVKAFEQLIHANHQENRYKLRLSGAGPRSFTFTVYSDSIFYQDFKFERKGKWQPEKPNWITCFSEDADLIKELIK